MDAKGEIVGLGECSFTGLAASLFGLTDTYQGELNGAITIDPVAAGTVSADVKITTLNEDWAGEFDGERFTGDFDGTFSYDVYTFTFTGQFDTERK